MIQNETFPKVLILGHQFDDKTGMGITLANLFKDWPREKIVIAMDSINIEVCESIRPCFEYICVSNVGSSVEIKKVGRAKRLYRFFYNWINKVFGLNEIIYRPHFPNKFIKRIIEYDPDILFCSLGSLNRIKDFNYIEAYIPNAKKVIYIVDDWVNTKTERRICSKLWKYFYNKEFIKIIKTSSALLSICPFMSESYLKQYGKTFYPFHNPVDLNYWKSLPSNLKYSDDTTSILFTGKINDDTKDCLLDTCKVVEQLNKEGHKFVFDVYSPNANMHPDLFSHYPSCHLFSAIPHDEIPTVTKGYSAMLLTLGFSKESRKYVRLSMPTKLSEYLAAGIPTVLYCPKEIALSQYLKDKDCVFPCYKRDGAMLRDCMLALENKDTCSRIVSNALKLAEDHDMPVVRERFEQQMKKFSEQ